MRMLMYTETSRTRTQMHRFVHSWLDGERKTVELLDSINQHLFVYNIYLYNVPHFLWVCVCPNFGSSFSGVLRHFPILFQLSVSRLLWLTALHACICSSHIPSPLLLSLLQPHPFLSLHILSHCSLPSSAVSCLTPLPPLLTELIQIFWALLSLPMSWYLPLCKV